MAEVPGPAPGPGEPSARVHAAGATTADRRLRAAAFPGVMQPPGRLMFSPRRPRRPVLGPDFAGIVAAWGEGATGFAVASVCSASRGTARGPSG